MTDERYVIIDGDLITLAKKGMFDVITHGCNCFCNMGAGIAPQMAFAFGCNQFELEDLKYRGNVNKLGQVDYQTVMVIDARTNTTKPLHVVNSYTQYSTNPYDKPLDYQALALCMRKINMLFKGQVIGLPMIGAGLAGGDWNFIEEIIKRELKDCYVIVVNYKPNR